MPTKVIFRKFPDGDIIAIFPELPGDSSPSTCLSYMHIGQHSAADPRLPIPLAIESEYAELMRELVRIGYTDLKVYKRISRHAYRIRRDQL